MVDSSKELDHHRLPASCRPPGAKLRVEESIERSMFIVLKLLPAVKASVRNFRTSFMLADKGSTSPRLHQSCQDVQAIWYEECVFGCCQHKDDNVFRKVSTSQAIPDIFHPISRMEPSIVSG